MEQPQPQRNDGRDDVITCHFRAKIRHTKLFQCLVILTVVILFIFVVVLLVSGQFARGDTNVDTRATGSFATPTTTPITMVPLPTTVVPITTPPAGVHPPTTLPTEAPATMFTDNDDNDEQSDSSTTPTVPSTLADGAKVAVVSGYEPSTLLNTTVTVDLPFSNVILILTSYEKIHWWVQATLGTNLTAILIASYERSTLIPPGNVPVYHFEYNDLPMAIDIDNIKFVQLLRKLNSLFPSLDHTDAFYGAYTLEETVLVDKLVHPLTPEYTLEGPRSQSAKEDTNFEFELLTANLEVVSWTLNGPIEGSSLTADYYFGSAAFTNTSIYLFDDDTEDRFRIVDRATRTEQTTVPMPITFPTVSWPLASVIDTRRQILSLSARNGIYRYNIKTQEWIDVVELEPFNFGLASLVYDEILDRYIGIESLRSRLVYMSFDWKSGVSGSVSIASRLAGFGRLFDSGNGPDPHLLLAQHGDDLALIHLGGGILHQFGVKDSVPVRVWHYNTTADNASLTYAADP